MRATLKTKSSSLLIIPAILLAFGAGQAQTSASKTASANRAWPAFWQQFTAAVSKNDRVAFKKLMAPNFADDSGGLKGTEWLRFMDENKRQGSWRDFQKSVAGGTVVHKEWSGKGVPTRITKDQGYYFEFRKDGKWYFAGVVGD